MSRTQPAAKPPVRTSRMSRTRSDRKRAAA